MNKPRFAAATAVLAALALPAAATAHPGVYTVTQQVFPQGGSCRIPDTSCFSPSRTQYAVANDGWAMSFTENGDMPAGVNRGVINYKPMPGTWRGENRETMRTYAPAQTDLQAHDICTGIAALETGD